MKNLRLFTLIVCLAFGTDLAHAGAILHGGFVISKPGKYKLVRNLVARGIPDIIVPVGIKVAASDVELDLAGFTIAPPGQPALGIGIFIAPGVARVHVSNGRIRDMAVGIVVGTTTTDARECLLERIQISNCAQHGIDLYGDSHVIRQCTLTKCPTDSNGIRITAPPLGMNEITDCTIGSEVFADTGITTASDAALFIRRCTVHRFVEGFHVTPQTKLFDNLTSGCADPFTGNPVLVGSNN